MEKELEEAKAEIERLKSSLDDKEYIIKSQWDETETLKALVAELQKKSSEAEKDDKSPKNNQSERGDLQEDLEERHRKVEDELKWKVEQFDHLEEAYDKLRDQFRTSKTEWETEKTSLVDEITKLQESIDDGNRTVEGLKSQLAMCKQGLENEESRRKKVEEQVVEMKSLLESATLEGFEGNVGECSVTESGEEEVASLRHALRVKEMDYKDMEYKAKKLERENEELLTSIKELQEAHIPRAVPTPSSWAKLKSRLKSLEQNHKECTTNLRAKEVEWSCKANRMSLELKRCSSNLQVKDEIIEGLKKELEGCNSSYTQLKMQNEELSLMLQLMRSEGTEKRECGVAHLMEQLEKEKEEKVGMQEEIDKLRDEIEELHDALDMIDSELTDQSNERSEVEFELENWKSMAAHLERQFTGSQSMRRELELSLLAQAEIEELLKLDTEEKEKRIGNLEQQIILMDQEIRIEEDDDTTEEDDNSESQQLEMDDNNESQQLEMDDNNESQQLEMDDNNESQQVEMDDNHESQQVEMDDNHESQQLEMDDNNESQQVEMDDNNESQQVEMDDNNESQQLEMDDNNESQQLEMDDNNESQQLEMDDNNEPQQLEMDDNNESQQLEMDDNNESQQLEMDDDEQIQLELMARELEEAIVGHIMGEKNYTFEQNLQEEPAQLHETIVHEIDNDWAMTDLEGEEACASKENASQQHSHSRKTSDTIIEERSPFKELN